MDEKEYLFQLVRLYYTYQKQRKAFQERVRSVKQGRSKDIPAKLALFEKYLDRFKGLEGEISKDIEIALRDHAVYPYMASVKGIAHKLAAQVISQVDIREADTVSALWKYAGLAVTDGKADRLKTGERSPYNVKLKSVMYNVGRQFLRSNSPYREVYDQWKDYYLENRDWTKAHCDMAALRKMEKLFLSHLWWVWRRLEGLPTRELYVVEKLGHSHVIEPDRFGWFDKMPKP